MKKIFSVLLILALCASVVACGTANDDPAVTEPLLTELTPDAAEGSVGAIHWERFKTEVETNPDATVEELAAAVVAIDINQFASGSMPVEEGLLSGFSNYEVKGFESGAQFGPMMGSIAYIGYIFELAEDADVAAFVAELKANCNPRWQVCVEADQTAVGAIRNKVFFLMCPSSYEMEIPSDEASIIAPSLEEVPFDTVGDMHWVKFTEVATANPDATAEEIAAQVVALDINEFSYGTAPVEAGLLPGFSSYEVKGFKEAAMFGPMMGSFAYIGYIFELEEGEDVEGFINAIKENCDPSWQICVTADQVAVGAVDNTVFFLMCPAQYNADAPAQDVGGMAL